MKHFNDLNVPLSFQQAIQQGLLAPKLVAILHAFHTSYFDALCHKIESREQGTKSFEIFLDLLARHLQHPPTFGLFHQAVRAPFDYYQFGLDFMRPLIRFADSKVFQPQRVGLMKEQLKQGENVILLANHQTEPDPQAIGLLLESIDSTFASNMIFVAGHRVITDPMAIPLSLGCNLLCIYSKRHISHPPEEKPAKMLHNQKTMKKMQELLSEGGKCIYVAPSGGRDRRNAEGKVEIAPFDAQSIEMFWLMAQQSEKPVRFYPLTLSTYDLLPPPSSIEKDIGENRQTQCTPIHLAFGNEIDMENFPGSQGLDKRAKRAKRADYIWNLVKQDYEFILKQTRHTPSSL